MLNFPKHIIHMSRYIFPISGKIHCVTKYDDSSHDLAIFISYCALTNAPTNHVFIFDALFGRAMTIQ